MTTPPRSLIPFPGSEIIYAAATGMERSLADSDCERLLGIDAEEIISVWDPYMISARNLPYLAWAMGVLLWEPDWQEATKREWVARQWEWKSLRGTHAGIEMAVNFVGRDYAQMASVYDLVQTVTPPQGFFASEDMTKEEWDSWVHLMPELRIKLTEGRGEVAPDEFVTGVDSPEYSDPFGFADDGIVPIDDGWILHGRRVILRQGGVDVPLQNVERTTWTEEGKTIDIERVHIPGKSTLGLFADDIFSDDDMFVGSEELPAKIISLRLDGSYIHEQSTYGLSMVVPSLKPLDPRYERESDIRPAGAYLFADDYFAGVERDDLTDPTPENVFAGVDYGGDMLADRIFLLDPNVAAPMTAGSSFADIDRVGMPLYHAEALIDLHTREDGPSWFSDETVTEEAYASEEDGSHIDRACRAVVAAKALRDKLSVSFQVLRPLAPQDIVDEATMAGAYRRNLL